MVSNHHLRLKWNSKEVVGKNFIKACTASKIYLNLVRIQNLPSHNMRTFELPACKVFSINTNTEENKIIYSTTIQEIIEKYNLPSVDILKMDCEGSEKIFFNNLSKSILNKMYNY